VAPIQFAAAAAALVNGGELVQPTFLRRFTDARGARTRVVSAQTSARMRDLLRRNVTDPAGTGRRADVPGYRVGGKTGTAEMPGRGGYDKKAVISSFLAAFPMDGPRYLVLVMLFEPKGTEETKGEILAGLNAAPTAARVIARIAPLLGVLPDGAVAALAE
jgi:cell division protein FtsI (penicillin-binding protein 3)